MTEIVASRPRLGAGLAVPRPLLLVVAAVVGLTATGAVLWAADRPGQSPPAVAEAAVSPRSSGSSTAGRDERTAATGPTTTASRAPTTTTEAARSGGPTGAVGDGGAPGPTAPPAAAGPSSTCPSTAVAPGADIDGDGCGDGEARVVDHTVTVGDEQFVLGRPGDRVLLGDWDCDGLVTAVLARPDPAAVWHFSTWAPPGATVTAVLVSDHVDPATVRRERVDGSCDRLTATDLGSGRTVPVAVTP